jgi:hypothetical protein
MDHDLANSVALLRRTPRMLNALLRDLPDAWTMANEGGTTWTAFDIVGHLTHGDRTDWIPRARMILEFGESKAFVRFDREAQKRESAGRTLSELLDEFADGRTAALATLEAFRLQPADLERRGRHPVFGPVTLGQLLSTWATHDLTHLHQLSRVMAYQYRDNVGPWKVFLGVLQCQGRSAPA